MNAASILRYCVKGWFRPLSIYLLQRGTLYSVVSSQQNVHSSLASECSAIAAEVNLLRRIEDVGG